MINKFVQYRPISFRDNYEFAVAAAGPNSNPKIISSANALDLFLAQAVCNNLVSREN